MRKLATLAAAIIIAVVIILAYQSSRPAEIDEKLSCESDSDCVPAACCHSDSAVSKKHAPDCKDTFCTAVCTPKTLDCNQGKIKCIKNQCRVVLND